MPIWRPYYLDADAIRGMSLYSVLANLSTSTQDRERFTPILIPAIEPDDPMALFIKARYGFLNETRASEILGRDNLKYELRLNDFVTVQTVEFPKSEDSFLNYVIHGEETFEAQKRHIPLVDYTFIGLTRDLEEIETPAVLDRQRESHTFNRAQYLLIVSEGESVEDFCWYWNLRTQRYLVQHNKLPLWLPKQIVISKKSQVRQLLNRGSGSHLAECFLLSKTVSITELEAIAKELGKGIGVANSDLDKFYHPGFRLGVKDKVEAFFSNGVANISLPQAEPVKHCFHPTYYYLDIEIPRYQLPRINARTWGRWIFPSYRVSKTGLSFHSPWDNRGYLTVVIPTAWELLESFANVAGYDVEYSDKGKMSERIIQLVKGVPNLWVLSGRMVYELFDELSELSQAKEFKGRLKRLADSLDRENPDDLVNQMMQAIASDHHDRVLKSYGDIKNSLKFSLSGSQKTTEQLVSWLIDKGVIFRGVELICPICSTKQWKYIDDLEAKMRCVGCQETVNTPLEVNSTNWRYRINTLYAKAHEQGVIPHLLTLSYALRELGISRSHPLGLFPGVRFKSQKDHEAIMKEIEIDVAWLDNGLLTIGECKTRGKDLSFREVERYIEFGQRIGCHQIVFSALDGFNDLKDEVKQLIESSTVRILCLGESELFYQHHVSQDTPESLLRDFEERLADFLEAKSFTQ